VGRTCPTRTPIQLHTCSARRADAPDAGGRQWKDLPYADCTWETAQDIFAAGGQDCVDDFQARARAGAAAAAPGLLLVAELLLMQLPLVGDARAPAPWSLALLLQARMHAICIMSQ